MVKKDTHEVRGCEFASHSARVFRVKNRVCGPLPGFNKFFNQNALVPDGTFTGAEDRDF